MKEAYDRTIPPREIIENLLNRDPAGPDFTQPTIKYCEEVIEATVDRVKKVLTRQYPETEEAFSLKLQGLIHAVRLGPPDVLIVDEEKYLKFPGNKRFRFNRILDSVYEASSNLVLLEYATALIPPRSNSEIHGRYPWFNNRLGKIAEAGGFKLDSPEMEIIAVSYITQVAKILAVNKSHELLKRVSTFAGIANLEKLNDYLTSFGNSIRQIKTHQAFMAHGFSVLNEIKEKGGLDDNQVQLLLDLAFIRNRAFDQPAEFREVLEPIIGLIGKNRWSEAYSHRDFLLKYFASSFPDWRVKKYEDEENNSSYLSFKDITRSIAEHRLDLSSEDIPSEYKALFEDILPKKIVRAERNRDSEIIENSLGLSRSIVREISSSYKIKFLAAFLKEEYGEEANKVVRIFNRFSHDKDRREAFMELMEGRDPDLPYFLAEQRYHRLKAYFETGSRPYIVKIPEEQREILDIEIQSDNQIYWYPTEVARSSRDPMGSRQDIFKAYSSFGRLLNDLIIEAYNENPEKQTLNLSELGAALITTYRKEKILHPKLFYKLSDYVKALIVKARLGIELTGQDPVLTFINKLDSEK